MNTTEAIKSKIVACMRQLVQLGLTSGTSGNASVRVRGGMLITPTGIPADQLNSSEIVRLTLDGEVEAGMLKPSSEWLMHAGIYQARPDINAIVHCHSRFATALACLRRDIPSFHYMVAVAGGDSVRCAPYATFGTQELAQNALAALDGRKACLLANHGQISIGIDLNAALALANEIEVLAAQYQSALATGEPVLLDQDEMARVIALFENYGQPQKN